MVTKSKNGVKSYSDSRVNEINTLYSTIADGYIEFAKEKYHIDFRVPKLSVIRYHNDHSNTAGFYSKRDKRIRIYNISVYWESEFDRKNRFARVLSHELGHALADQLGMMNLKPGLNSNVGDELLANIFSAEAQAKLNHRTLTSYEVAKQLILLEHRGLSYYLSDSSASKLNFGLGDVFNWLNKEFEDLNKYSDHYMDAMLNSSENVDFEDYSKFKDRYSNKYTRLFKKYYNTEIISKTVNLGKYMIPVIAATNALAEGVPVDEVINAPFSEDGIFGVPGLDEYWHPLNACNDLGHFFSYGMRNFKADNRNNLRLLRSNIRKISSKSDGTLSPKDLSKVKDMYKKDYDSMVGEAKVIISSIEVPVNMIMRELQNLSEDADKVKSMIHLDSVKSMERR